MEAHNRDLYLYKRLNAQVLGVSMDDPVTLKYFAESLELEFPLVNSMGLIGINPLFCQMDPLNGSVAEQ